MKVMSRAKNSRSSNNGTYNFKIQLLYLMKYEDLLGQCSASCTLCSAVQTLGISVIKVRINAFKVDFEHKLNNLISLTSLNHHGCNSTYINCRAMIAFKLQTK